MSKTQNVNRIFEAGAELRPERIQLQARISNLVSEPNWEQQAAGTRQVDAALVGVFGRPVAEEIAPAIYLLTDLAPRYGIHPKVEFLDSLVRVTFPGIGESLDERVIGFAGLVQALLPAVAGNMPADEPTVEVPAPPAPTSTTE